MELGDKMALEVLCKLARRDRPKLLGILRKLSRRLQDAHLAIDIAIAHFESGDDELAAQLASDVISAYDPDGTKLAGLFE